MTLDKVHVKEHFGDTKVNEPGSLPSLQTPLGKTLLKTNPDSARRPVKLPFPCGLPLPQSK